MMYLNAQREGMPWGGDTALFIMHGRNLVHGEAYAKTPYVYDDEAWMEGGASFPPGMPLLLLPHLLKDGPVPFAAMRIECVILLALAAVPVFLFLRRYLTLWGALVATAVFGLNRFTLYFLQGIYSEEAYLLFSFAAIAAIYWINDTGRDKTKPILWGALAGLLITCPYLIRSIGVSFVVGFVLSELYRNRRITRFLVSAVVVFAGIALLSSLLAHSDTAYRSQLRIDPLLALQHFKEYTQRSMELWLGLPGTRLPRLALWLLTTALACYGLFGKLRARGPELHEFYTLAYVGVLAIYWAANHRYLSPLLPIYLLCVFYAIESLWREVQWMRPALLATATLMLYAGGAYWAGIERTPLPDGVHTANYQQTLDFVRKETAPQSRVISDSARYLALLTGRPSLLYPMWSTPDKVWAFVERTNSEYIILSKLHTEDQTYLAPALRLHPEALDLRFENAEYAVYKVKRNKG